MNLLVRFRVMDIGTARILSGTRIALVKKRCAWYLRVKFEPLSELPYAEGEEFL